MIHQTIILDLDETLISTIRRQYEVMKAFFEHSNCQIPISFGEYLNCRKSSQYSNTQVFNKLNSFNLSLDTYRAFYLSHIESLFFLSYDTLLVDIDLFASVRNDFRDVHFLLLSLRSDEENSLAQLENLRLRSMFNKVVFLKHDIENPKSTFLKRFLHQKNKDQFQFIGDSDSDYLAAQTVGIKFIGVNTGLYKTTNMESPTMEINQILKKTFYE